MCDYLCQTRVWRLARLFVSARIMFDYCSFSMLKDFFLVDFFYILSIILVYFSKWAESNGTHEILCMIKYSILITWISFKNSLGQIYWYLRFEAISYFVRRATKHRILLKRLPRWTSNIFWTSLVHQHKGPFYKPCLTILECKWDCKTAFCWCKYISFVNVSSMFWHMFREENLRGAQHILFLSIRGGMDGKNIFEQHSWLLLLLSLLYVYNYHYL